jgi:hypothetical protein
MAVQCQVNIMSIDLKQLISDLRGGAPHKCDFCGEMVEFDQIHPEEAGLWICYQCIQKDPETYFGRCYTEMEMMHVIWLLVRRVGGVVNIDHRDIMLTYDQWKLVMTPGLNETILESKTRETGNETTLT